MMFEYFPANYPWSMATVMAVNAGGVISEIDEVLSNLRDIAEANDEKANQAWHDAWSKLGERNRRLSEADANLNFNVSSGEKLLRAACYFMTAERMCKSNSPLRLKTYKKMLDCFDLGVRSLRDPVTRVEIPFKNTCLPGLFYPAQEYSKKSNSPCIIHFDGLDVMKEFLFLIGVPQQYARRGISTLLLDHPGVGEALRLKDLKLSPETEEPASAAVDYLESREDVDPKKLVSRVSAWVDIMPLVQQVLKVDLAASLHGVPLMTTGKLLKIDWKVRAQIYRYPTGRSTCVGFWALLPARK